MKDPFINFKYILPFSLSEYSRWRAEVRPGTVQCILGRVVVFLWRSWAFEFISGTNIRYGVKDKKTKFWCLTLFGFRVYLSVVVE